MKKRYKLSAPFPMIEFLQGLAAPAFGVLTFPAGEKFFFAQKRRGPGLLPAKKECALC